MGVDQNGHLAKTKLMALFDNITSVLFISATFPCWTLLAGREHLFLGTCRHNQFGFTSLKSHQVPESKSARARADHQGLFRLRSPHDHVISSYQPQAIPLMTQARVYTLAKHR
jgi:hypothetical protein